jgi:excisionase family DNA binding protein
MFHGGRGDNSGGKGQGPHDQVAGRLGVSVTVVRRLIHSKTIPATQVVPGAPWHIPVAAVESPELLQAARDIKNRHRPSGPQFRDECTLQLTGFGPFDEEGKSQERLRT